jgi:hypothetical protein
MQEIVVCQESDFFYQLQFTYFISSKKYWKRKKISVFVVLAASS